MLPISAAAIFLLLSHAVFSQAEWVKVGTVPGEYKKKKFEVADNSIPTTEQKTKDTRLN